MDSDFGFTRLSASEKTRRVQQVFASVAPHYDRMNDLMSLGLQRAWKASFGRDLGIVRGRLLDVACGSGDIFCRWLRQQKTAARAIALDPSPAMLAHAEQKAINAGFLGQVEFITAAAEQIPLRAATVDGISIAFGLRNVTDRSQALAEMARVLRPGGHFFCLEFAPVALPWLRALYDRYSFRILPWLGETVAGDRAAYQYLAESIRRFPTPSWLAQEMYRAGLRRVCHRPLSLGIVQIHHAVRI